MGKPRKKSMRCKAKKTTRCKRPPHKNASKGGSSSETWNDEHCGGGDWSSEG